MRLMAQALVASFLVLIASIVGSILWKLGVLSFLLIYVVAVLWAVIYLSPENP